MALINCNICKKDYSDNLVACFHCGQPNPDQHQVVGGLFSSRAALNLTKPNRHSFGLASFAVLIVVGLVYAYFNVHKLNISEVGQENIPKLIFQHQPESAYDDPAVPMLNDEPKYRDAMFGNYQKNKPVVVGGKVLQILDDKTILIATRVDENQSLADLISNGFRFNGNEIMVTFDDTPRILEGDVVGIKGQFLGVKPYEKLSDKSEVNVPTIADDYYTVGNIVAYFSKRNEAIRKASAGKDVS